MKRFLLHIGCFLALATMFGCNDFLDRDPLDKLTNDSYWTDETSLRSYAQDFYYIYFAGYAQDYRSFGGYFSGDIYNDDFLLTSENSTDTNQRLYFPGSETTGINSVVATWKDQYTVVRKANVMLENIPGMNIAEETKKHWTGVARFFRALAYSTLVKTYGEVPYIDTAVDPSDNLTLYKERESQSMVVGKILEDYQYALENVRLNDGTLQVHKYLVGALMSRNMLYHATWLKYHGTTVGSGSATVADSELNKFFQGAIDGANLLIDATAYNIGNTYNALFTSLSLADNPEIIFYREYVSGLSCNALMAYNAGENQNLGGTTVDAIESFLCLDGLPVGQSPSYQGGADPKIENAFIDRDPRLYDMIVDSLRILNSGLFAAASPTGFASKKFLNEDWNAEGLAYVTGLLSPADAPIIRYAEVLLNYVEARYEISKVGGTIFAQADLDASINEIRGRTLTKWGERPSTDRTMPTVTLDGNNLRVNGTIINDPARDQDVDPVLWEIRRERRMELLMEGRRGDDLNRWAKYEYLNSANGTVPSKKILGAWINKADYPNISENVVLHDPDNPGNNATEGYINYYYARAATLRTFTKGELISERNYLRAIPSEQITAYKDKGFTLTQNPGW